MLLSEVYIFNRVQKRKQVPILGFINRHRLGWFYSCENNFYSVHLRLIRLTVI